MKPNIMELIVAHDLCIGCGVCSGICPVDVLPMSFNRVGEYSPNERDGCLDRCSLCVDVCPFVDKNDNEDILGASLYKNNETKYTFETGYYKNTYISYNKEDKSRLNATSGGVSTWLLKKLYEDGLVDRIVCVGHNPNPKKLFDYKINSDLSFLSSNTGSVYYPVELSDAIKEIIKTDGKYIITGLPCFIKAIRLAQKKNRKLRNRIKYTVALTCGQMKSKYYTEHLIDLSGVEGDIRRVHYRGKDSKEKASNFYFSAINSVDESSKLYWKSRVKTIWTNRWYTPNACDYCDDVFGETADISVMDAWLPEYIKDSKGTSLIITRDKEIDQLIKNSIEQNSLGGREISVKKIIKSQQGVLDIKRDKLSYRLFLAEKNSLKVPKKRVLPSSTLSFFEKREIEIKSKMQKESKKNIIKNQKLDIEKIDKIMNPLLFQIERVKKVEKLAILPKKVANKILRKIKERV
jgi:coenzyme F420-reducing hydrogenase beta subunit